jgi:urease accessory protein
MSIFSSNGTGRPVSGTSLAGHLALTCEVRTDGRSHISHQDFRAPIHIGKGHHDQGCMVLNIVNPTAGFFDGDQVDSKIVVGTGARLALGTPSAARVYRSRSGRDAANHQEFHVGRDAFLEWLPEPFIPHAGARYLQTTRLHLHPAADLLFFEWLAPGRVAMGETFVYQNLRWELDLHLGCQLVVRERYDLRPDNHSLEALRARFPAAHYLTVLAAGKMTRNWPAEELDSLNGETLSLGHGPVSCGVHVIRALCRDSLAARGLLESLRKLLYSSAEMKPPALGRIFS